MKITDLAAQRAIDRLAQKGFDGLTEVDQTVAATWLIDAAVTNDGFARLFGSKRGNLAFHAPAALRKIGARKLADIAENANGLFGPAGPPPGYRERRALLRAFDDVKRHKLEALNEQYYAASELEDVDDLLEIYLEKSASDPTGEDKARGTD